MTALDQLLGGAFAAAVAFGAFIVWLESAAAGVRRRPLAAA